MDEAQFDALYSSSARRLIGVIYAVTGDLGEAQDVVNEAFLRAWDRRTAPADVQHPEAWVRTVAWRLAVSRWRRTRNAVAAWRRLGPPNPVPEPGLDHLVLAGAMAQLKPTHRRVLVLHYLCDLSVEAIARPDRPAGRDRQGAAAPGSGRPGGATVRGGPTPRNECGTTSGGAGDTGSPPRR